MQGPCRAQGRDFRVPLQVVGRSQRRSAVPRPAAYAVQHQRPPLAVRCRHARKDLDTPFTRDRHPNSLAFALTSFRPATVHFWLTRMYFPCGRPSLHLPVFVSPSPGLPASPSPRLAYSRVLSLPSAVSRSPGLRSPPPPRLAPSRVLSRRPAVAASQSLVTWGREAVYASGGYVVDLPRSTASMSAAIAELKRRGWIDKSTRAVYIEFTLYNAPGNLVVPTAVLLEFPGTATTTSFWDRCSRICQHHATANAPCVICPIRGACAYPMLIGGCNPIRCVVSPIHVFFFFFFSRRRHGRHRPFDPHIPDPASSLPRRERDPAPHVRDSRLPLHREVNVSARADCAGGRGAGTLQGCLELL